MPWFRAPRSHSLSKPNARQGLTPPAPRRLQLEQLEERTTPTVDLLYQNMVGEIMEQAPALFPGTSYYLARMRADGSFTDLSYSGASDASAGDIQGHGKRLEVLSLAYKWDDPGNTYYNSPELRAQILQGWSYLATRAGSINAPNWWWKAIGVPQGMAEGLILMRDEMSATVRNQVLTKYFSTVWTPSKYDGANVTYQAPMAIVDGLLRGNTARIRDVVSRVSGEIMAYAGEGIQTDLSFQQHNFGGKRNYYSGHYGLILAEDTAQVMRWTAGTDFAFGNSAVDQELRFLLDHLQWLTRGDTFDVASMGRMITYNNQLENAPQTLQRALADMLPLDRRTDELWGAIDRYYLGVTDDNALSGNKSLWRSDAVIHSRPEMLTTLRMLSSRSLRPETAAGGNTRGFFEGDGFTLFVQDGDELGGRGEQDIFPVWDWQRVPGTTVQHNGKIPYYDLFKTTTNSAGSSAVVGSVSDGTYGAALMDYRRGGVSLKAKKSWFFFDDEVVALGADIDDATAASPVYTSLNQVLLDGPVTVQDAAGRRTLDLGGSASLTGLSWVQHDDLGYVNLDPTSRITVQAKTQSGGGAALPVFSAWVDHGVRPLNKTYAYAVVPGVSPDDLDAYAADAPISILSNTATVQAVRHNGLGRTQAAFFAAGATWIDDDTWVAVNQPALLMIREVNGDLEITAADPRQSAATLTIDVNRRLVGPGTTWQADRQVTRIAFALPSDRGSSVTRTYAAMQGEVVQLSAAADAYVRNGTYANKNYGTTTALSVQNYVTGYSQEGFVRFDASAIQGEIVYAAVRLQGVGGTMPVTVAAAPVADDAWSETGLTWNNKPASGAEIGRVSLKQGQYATFDVTNLLREAASGDGQLSLRLYSPTYAYYAVSLGTHENASANARPMLEVYVKPPAPPAEGEAPAQHIGLADYAPPQVIGPLRLSDALALGRFNHFIGPVLPPAPAAPPPPVEARPNRRLPPPQVWDPAAVDFALDQFLEPALEDEVTT